MHHPLLENLTCLWFPDWIPLISSPTSLNFFFSDFDSSIHSPNVYLPKHGLPGVPLFSLLFHLAIQLSGPQQLVLCDWHPNMYFSLPPKFTFFISMYLDILLPYRTQLYMYSPKCLSFPAGPLLGVGNHPPPFIENLWPSLHSLCLKTWELLSRMTFTALLCFPVLCCYFFSSPCSLWFRHLKGLDFLTVWTLFQGAVILYHPRLRGESQPRRYTNQKQCYFFLSKCWILFEILTRKAKILIHHSIKSHTFILSIFTC